MMAAGVVVSRPDLTVLDTRELPWEGVAAALPRVLAKPLSVDADGDATVHQRWMTDWSPDPAKTTNGFRLAREYYFCLSGSFSHYERDVEGGHDELIVFTQGVWMDRAPGSLTSGATEVPVGVKGLGWLSTGDDSYVGLMESAELTDTLSGPSWPAAASTLDNWPSDPTGVRLRTDFTTVLDSRALPWQPHPLLPGVRYKALSRRGGEPTIHILGLPAGPAPAGLAGWRGSHRYRELTYVLEGELRLRVFAGPHDADGEELVLREGYWIDRRPGSVYGFGDGELTPSGCVLLTVRLRAGVELIKEKDKYLTWTRTLTAGPARLAPAATPEELARLRQRHRDTLREGRK